MLPPQVETAKQERLRAEIQGTLDSARSLAKRNQLGQFATPYELAAEITRYVGSLLPASTGGIRFADPSCGTGSFFSSALAVFGPDRIRSAVGIEIDADFANAALSLWSERGLQVICGDFTRIVADDLPPQAPNLILANPPYVRHHHIDREEKVRLQSLAYQLTGLQVNGLAGLYVYFVLLASAWLEDGGYAAWLIPSEFMDVNYGTALKRYLTDRVTLVRAHRFEPADVQFDDALVSSVVVVLRKAQPPDDHVVEFTFGGTMANPDACEQVSLKQLRDSRKWSEFPIHATNDRRCRNSGHGPMLADFFNIQRGIATGGNSFFVLERAEAERRRLPTDYLRPILPSPRHLKSIIIESDGDGYPRIDRQLCVIDCDLPESVVELRHPSLWQYLQNAEALGVKDGYLVGKRTPWYKQERRDPCPFLCTYMGRGANEKRPFRFVLNCSRAIATNLYLMLYPKSSLGAMLHEHPERLVEVHEILGRITGHELRGEGRVYGGGLYKIEPGELGRVHAAAFVERWPELAVPNYSRSQLGLFGS
ncbi:MAG TPA: N-6 DNA methylase [Pirellulaceae bacterium]|nr:N-6 DNA methylase [Pirellulaceae bacterium]